MMKARCVNKARDQHGRIYRYDIITEAGDRFSGTAYEIKDLINNNKYNFTNLQIDKAGRLVDKTEYDTTGAKIKVLDTAIKGIIDEKVEFLYEKEFVETILYGTTTGVELLGLKLNLNKQIIKECIERTSISPCSSTHDSSIDYNGNSGVRMNMIRIEKCDELINYYKKYIQDNLETLKFKRSIKRMSYMQVQMHEEVERILKRVNPDLYDSNKHKMIDQINAEMKHFNNIEKIVLASAKYMEDTDFEPKYQKFNSPMYIKEEVTKLKEDLAVNVAKMTGLNIDYVTKITKAMSESGYDSLRDWRIRVPKDRSRSFDFGHRIRELIHCYHEYIEAEKILRANHKSIQFEYTNIRENGCSFGVTVKDV